jgi:hypothetical protein
MIRIAIAGMSRDDDDGAPHSRCQMRASAIVTDEKIATFKHCTGFAEHGTADNYRCYTKQVAQFHSFTKLGG